MAILQHSPVLQKCEDVMDVASLSHSTDDVAEFNKVYGDAGWPILLVFLKFFL